MRLILKVLSYKSVPYVKELSVEFNQQGGSIGRQAFNTLALEDMDKIVSGRHADIVYENEQFCIKDHSVNGTYLLKSGQSLNNAQTVLQNNEILRIGEYELLVELISDKLSNLGAHADNVFDSPFASPSNSPLTPAASEAGYPFSDTFGNKQDTPIVGGLFSDAGPFANPDESAHTGGMFSGSGFNEQPFEGLPVGTFSEGFPTESKPPLSGLFTDQSPLHESFTLPPVVAPEPPSHDIAKFLQGLDALPGAEPMAVELAFPAEGEQDMPANTSLELDLPIKETPLPVFDAPLQETPPLFDSPFQPIGQTVSDESNQEMALPIFEPPFAQTKAMVLEAPLQETISPASDAPIKETLHPLQNFVNRQSTLGSPGLSSQSQDSKSSPADEAKLMLAFLEGAGIKDASFLPVEQWPEIMRSTGALFRTMIEGLMDVMRARAEMKSEFRVAVTTLRSLDNNPLKFNPDVENVMKLMLGPHNPAFIKSGDAVNEAFRDLKSHQMAITAGIQASLAEILHRFDPECFEKAFVEGLVFQKKAKCWELYCEKYPQFKTQAMEDFFGEEFADAYEKQMRQLGRP